MTYGELQAHVANVARLVAKAIGGGDVADELGKIADALDPPAAEPTPEATPEPAAEPEPDQPAT